MCRPTSLALAFPFALSARTRSPSIGNSRRGESNASGRLWATACGSRKRTTRTDTDSSSRVQLTRLRKASSRTNSDSTSTILLMISPTIAAADLWAVWLIWMVDQRARDCENGEGATGKLAARLFLVHLEWSAPRLLPSHWPECPAAPVASGQNLDQLDRCGARGSRSWLLWLGAAASRSPLERPGHAEGKSRNRSQRSVHVCPASNLHRTRARNRRNCAHSDHTGGDRGVSAGNDRFDDQDPTGRAVAHGALRRHVRVLPEECARLDPLRLVILPS